MKQSQPETGLYGPGPYLPDLRIVEMAGERCPIACAFAGRLLGELGATVIKVEPPYGDPTRRIGPFLDDIPGIERSLAFWYYNTNKQGIALEWRTADGVAILKRLLSGADILLHGLDPVELRQVGLGDEALRAINPRLIVTQVSPFGWDGPLSDYVATDVMHQALGGIMASTGYHDLPGSPPIAGDGGQSWHLGGQWAVIGALAAVLARDSGGDGQTADVTVHDACSVTTEMALPIYNYTGRLVRRQTGREAHDEILAPWQYLCGDGSYVSWVPVGIGPDRWMAIVEWLTENNMAEDLTDDTYYIPEVLQEKMGHVCEVMARFFATRDSREVYEGLQRRGLVSWVLNAPEDLVDDPHLAARNFFTSVDHPEGCSFTYPGSPWLINERPPLSETRRAPLLGEHNLLIFGGLGLSAMDISTLAEEGVV